MLPFPRLRLRVPGAPPGIKVPHRVDTGETPKLGVRIRGIKGTLGDIDPLNKVPFKRATSRVQKGPLQGVG